MNKRLYLPILIASICMAIICSDAIAKTTIVIDRDRPGKALIKTTGIGYPPAAMPDLRRARLLARRAAVLDGYRNLLAAFDEIYPHAQDRSFMLNQKGFLRGAKVLDTRYLDGGKAEVDVSIGVRMAQEKVKELERNGYTVAYIDH
jgi:hypothetical protein